MTTKKDTKAATKTTTESATKASKKTAEKRRAYVIIRTTGAGVHAGELESVDRKSGSVVLRNSRRIWRFNGAQTLSEIAVYGCTGGNHADSRIAPTLDRIEIFGVHEIVHCQPAGEEWVRASKEWRC